MVSSLDWLDAAEAAGHDHTPTASADWSRAVAALPDALDADGRLTELHDAIDRWAERRAVLRSDPLLDASERARRLARLDAGAEATLARHLGLLREAPILLQFAYVLAKQTQEEARLAFLPRLLVRFGRELADADPPRASELRAALAATTADLVERYAGLELVIGDLVHEGVEARELERAAEALPTGLASACEELGVERGLAEGRRLDRERASEVERALEAELDARGLVDRRARRVACEAFERGVERGFELGLDADRRALAVLEALTRRVDIGRLERLRAGLEGSGPRVLARVREAVAAALAGPDEDPTADARAILQRALERVLPRPGPRRRLAECLLDGDAEGAAAARLLLELKGLPFDRARELEALYRGHDPATIAAFERRFEAEFAAALRDARWLALTKRLVRPAARLVGRRALAERLRPLRPGAPLAEALDRKLRPVDRAAIEDFRRGDAAAAEVRLLSRALERQDAVQAADLLAGCSATGRVELARRFERGAAGTSGAGGPLRTALSDGLPPGPARDRALALLDGDPRRARVALLRGAFAGLEGHALFDALDGLTPEERARLIEDYELEYAGGADDGRGTRALRGLFDVDLRRMVGGERFELLGAVLRYGGLPPEDLCRYYMLGVGTNESGLLEVLRRLTREEVDEVVRRYDRKYRVHGRRALEHELPPRRAARRLAEERRRHGWRSRAVDLPLVGALVRRALLVNGLVGDIRTEVSGDAWFDLSDALRGTPDPDRPAETRERLLERRSHELSGRLVRRWKLFRRMQARLDADLELALGFYDLELAPAIEAGEPPPPGAARRFHHLAALVLQDFDQFRGVKNRIGSAVADRLAGVGGTLGGLAAVAAERSLHGESGIATLMLGGTLGAFLAKVVPKKLIAGDALGTEEIGIDLAHALVEGVGRLFNRLRRLGGLAVDGIQRGLGRTVFKVGARRTLDQVTRGVGGRLRARQGRLPELSVASFHLREERVEERRGRTRAAVVGRLLEHPDDAGLEGVFGALLAGWLLAGARPAAERGAADPRGAGLRS